MVLCKVKNNAICGGFTLKSLVGGAGKWVQDDSAFVFNMSKKFVVYNPERAIYVDDEGFTFGYNILRVAGSPLNSKNIGICQVVGKEKTYNIEGDKNGKSPLTGEKENFTLAELEVYKIV